MKEIYLSDDGKHCHNAEGQEIDVNIVLLSFDREMEKEILRFVQSRSGNILMAKARECDDVFQMRHVFEHGLVGDEKKHIPFLTTLMALQKEGGRKFRRSQEMLFTRRGYEQSTSEAISEYKASLIPNNARVAFLCSGIGGEALIASQKADVTLVDSDPVMIAMGEWNIGVYGGKVAATHCQTVEDFLIYDDVHYDAIFLDPDRRIDGRRTIPLKEYSPNIFPLFSRLFARSSKVYVKVSPMIQEELSVLSYLERIHYIEERGELKELMLEFTEGYEGIIKKKVVSIHSSIDIYESNNIENIELSELKNIPEGGYVLEPSPAMIKSGLLDVIAYTLDVQTISRTGALLYTKELPEHVYPWYTVYPVLEVHQYKPALLRKRLVALGISKAVIKKRYFPLEPHEIRAQLKIQESSGHVLIATTLAGTKRVLFIATSPTQYFT